MNLEGFLESTLLRADTRSEEIEKLCAEAMQYNLRGICVNPCYIAPASSMLRGSGVLPVTVVGFPLGADTGMVKARAAEQAVLNGALEIDMVINIGALKDGRKQEIIDEIALLKKAGAGLKVIIETGYLLSKEIALACHCAVEGGADFVKTSTGFGPRGASINDIILLRSILPDTVQIKAAGGVKSADFARKLIRAGASRIGTSSASAIMQEAAAEEEEP